MLMRGQISSHRILARDDSGLTFDVLLVLLLVSYDTTSAFGVVMITVVI